MISTFTLYISSTFTIASFWFFSFELHSVHTLYYLLLVLLGTCDRNSYVSSIDSLATRLALCKSRALSSIHTVPVLTLTNPGLGRGGPSTFIQVPLTSSLSPYRTYSILRVTIAYAQFPP